MAVKNQVIENNYALYNGDCVDVMQALPDHSIGLSVYSPPFGGLYHYSSDERDLSNSADYSEFFDHYRFVLEELTRITMPGRCTAVHCSDIPLSNSGVDFLRDLPGDIIKLHESLKWGYIARHTIWKEPLAVRNRTMAKCLTHRTVVEDAALAGVASADYLLIFRKRGTNPVPISNPTGLDYYAGETQPPADLLKYRKWSGNQIENRFSHWIWRRYASSIWDDIRINNVLPFVDCKEDGDEKHVHPLQLDVIERAVILRSNTTDTVFTPFMGVGSEVYGAVKHGRKAIGVELKESYFRQAVKNMESVDMVRDIQPDMFEK